MCIDLLNSARLKVINYNSFFFIETKNAGFLVVSLCSKERLISQQKSKKSASETVTGQGLFSRLTGTFCLTALDCCPTGIEYSFTDEIHIGSTYTIVHSSMVPFPGRGI